MKTFCLFLMALISALTSQGQQSLTGLWTGTLTNDSSTIRKDQSFEIALTEYKGKVYGYSRSTFIVHDTLFYTVKRVKGKIDGPECEVKDDDIISTNFPGRQDKGIKVTYTFRQRQEDSTWHLDGNWKTNKTKNFYSISGGVALRSEKNLDNSKIFPHLEELGKADDIAFYKEYKKPTPAAAEPRKNEAATSKAIAKETPPVKPAIKDTTGLAANRPVQTPTPATVPVPAGPAAFISSRTNATPQVVTFRSDSLVLALYDNGEIDGDTVSLVLNGELILAKQMLKATAIRKTIYLPAGADETTLILYAENLGKYPPNTGLLVIHDGEDTYQLRFSADLNQNAAVIFKRKKD